MKHPRGSVRKCRAGFTLVELTIAASLLLVVLGTAAMVAASNARMYKAESVGSHLEGRASLAMDKIVRELRIAGIDTLDPDLQSAHTSSVQYAQAVGIDAAGVVWTPRRRLEFQYALGEVDDGSDNNGNGLVDEGRVVLTTDEGGPEERALVITRWVAELLQGELANGIDDNANGLVDEAGFVLERVGETLIVRLTLQRRTDDGRLLTRSSQTSIRSRNRLAPEEEQ